MKGKTVQLKHPHLANGKQNVHVIKTNHTKIERAKRLGKGVRISLSEPEIEQSGGKLSWKGFKRGLSKVGKTLNKLGIVKPLVTAGMTALAGVTGQPELIAAAPTVGNVTSKLIGKGVKSAVIQNAQKPAITKRANAKQAALESYVNPISKKEKLVPQSSEGNGLYQSTKARGLYQSTSARGLTMSAGRGKGKKTVYI